MLQIHAFFYSSDRVLSTKNCGIKGAAALVDNMVRLHRESLKHEKKAVNQQK